MSISLPNGTLLAAPSSSQVQLSAAVTRILHLANFSADLKTRDLQNIFKEWENEKGGFRIKWLDDVNALVVFADASVAKRAYLALLLRPPPTFKGLIRPYDRPDAAQIIQSLAARALGHRASASNASGMNGGSVSFPFPANNDPAAPQVHSRAMSVTNHMVKSGSISIPGLPNPNAGVMAGGNGHSRGTTAPQRVGTGGSIGGGGGGVMGSFSFPNHHRTSSASSSFSGRPSFGGSAGLSGGVLSFGGPIGSTINRLPTHSESAMVSRSTSESDGEPNVVILDPSATQGWKTSSSTSFGPGTGSGSARAPRRESMSAEKAMREVEKALASVETRG
ncbi:hypothetical protein IAU60_000370 [Kwoniella sp. DSM 27419]